MKFLLERLLSTLALPENDAGRMSDGSVNPLNLPGIDNNRSHTASPTRNDLHELGIGY